MCINNLFFKRAVQNIKKPKAIYLRFSITGHEKYTQRNSTGESFAALNSTALPIFQSNEGSVAFNWDFRIYDHDGNGFVATPPIPPTCIVLFFFSSPPPPPPPSAVDHRFFPARPLPQPSHQEEEDDDCAGTRVRGQGRN